MAYRLQIKVGPHEFVGEGEESAVREDYAIWRELISAQPTIPIKSAGDSAATNSGKGEERTLPLDPSQRALFDRLFLVEDDRISLKIRPQGEDAEADALTLILHGYRVLRGVESVLATQLKAALVQSGFNVDRLDRIATRYLAQALIRRGGGRKSATYQLSNSGTARAAQLVSELTN
jgi:hypothetical protein